MVSLTNGALGWSSRIMGVLGGILFLALFHHPAPALGAVPALQSVTLAWGASYSPAGVTNYRVYYGVVSGNYTSSVLLGNVTTNLVPGLTSGVTYFFAVTGLDGNGVESRFSNEISFVPGAPTLQIRITATREAVLTVKGLAGHTYDLQATQEFMTWTNLGAVTTGVGGLVDFTDTNAASFPTRFYRTHDTQP